ncbi:membrane dipeptidase [Aureimonas endophytica]|uniref:Membrane dipeptidase n=1 Tax=Aureimonas endophytica TaxID=2027858 RepID=A0A916ZG92_9HYPH|nr:dipeptidase [Aureimonas endophytica]GGD95719.1 membrane dipeptidase [Aureimonas endophytica]
MPTDPILVFDGHNDTLLRLYGDPTGQAFEGFFTGGAGGHIDLPSARAGHLGGGLFAIFPPSPREASLSDAMAAAPYALPLPEPLDWAGAARATIEMAAILFRLEARSGGAFRVCRSAAEIEAARAAGAFAAVLHIEGAEAIAADLAMLDVLHAAGLRSLGPVWSRPNIFGHGVPMRFPSSPAIGDGLTEAGKALVRRCNALRILVDLSHLNEAGFDDVARLSDAPLVATHCNAHAVTPHSRNLTDRQLDAIRASGGLVGLNFATGFLRPDGCMNEETGFDAMLRHLDHLLSRLGEDGVALGSDFDGALIPKAIGSAAGLPALLAAMAEAGYGRALVEKIAWGNWLSVLRRTFGA